MAVTVASFQARYLEFASAPSLLVQACIDDATAELGANGVTNWGVVYDRAIALRTAHFLALSPTGSGLQLSARRDPNRIVDASSTSTVYEQQFLSLRRAHFGSAAVVL